MLGSLNAKYVLFIRKEGGGSGESSRCKKQTSRQCPATKISSHLGKARDPAVHLVTKCVKQAGASRSLHTVGPNSPRVFVLCLIKFLKNLSEDLAIEPRYTILIFFNWSIQLSSKCTLTGLPDYIFVGIRKKKTHHLKLHTHCAERRQQSRKVKSNFDLPLGG